MLADLPGAEASAPTSASGRSASPPTSSTEDGNVELIDAGRGGVRPDRPVLRQRRHRRRHRPRATTRRRGSTAFDVNVNAHRWAAKHLLPGWLARGEGYFCSTASAAGLLAQIGSAPYTVTKRAAVAFAEWLSITYGDRGLRVSCLCPQGVNTDMLRGSDQLGGGANVVQRRCRARARGGRRHRRRRHRRRALPDPPPPRGARVHAAQGRRPRPLARRDAQAPTSRAAGNELSTVVPERSPIAVGLRLAEPIRFRRHDVGRWVEGKVARVEPDGSITLHDPDGAARSLRPSGCRSGDPGRAGG